MAGFSDRAKQRWGDGEPAARLLEQIALGAADELTGRLLWAGDDLTEVGARCQADPDYRRLRLIR